MTNSGSVLTRTPIGGLAGKVAGAVVAVALLAGVGSYLLLKDDPGKASGNQPAGSDTAMIGAAPSKPEPAPGSVEVPNLICMDHQQAQDALQALGLRNLAEQDGAGKGRLLLVDHNWTVIKQSEEPGSFVDPTLRITLTSVKDDEKSDWSAC